MAQKGLLHCQDRESCQRRSRQSKGRDLKADSVMEVETGNRMVESLEEHLCYVIELVPETHSLTRYRLKSSAISPTCRPARVLGALE